MQQLDGFTGLAVSILFDAGVAFVFFMTWVNPAAGLAAPVMLLLLVMIVEFLLIHGTVFLETTWLSDETVERRLRTMGFIAIFYLAMATGFAAGFSSWFPIIAVAVLVANRVLGVVFEPHPGPTARRASERRWVRDVVLYLTAAFMTVFLPFPRLGLTEDVVASLDLPGSGLWISKPHRVMAVGAFYFGMRAVLAFREATRAA